jgi:eukaryotic-like serine/threonine-protein kinase
VSVVRYRFGPFSVDVRRRRLYRGDEALALPAKAIDLLMMLLERPQEVVEKEDLMRRLWPDTVVTESNLTQHVFTLRKTLGERSGDSQLIATVARRGYRFVGDVEIENASATTARTGGAEHRIARFTISLPDDLPVARLSVPVLAIAPDGRELIYVARAGATTVLCRRQLDRLGVDPISGTQGATTPFWSPDVEWLGFAANGCLRRIRRDGSVVQTIADSPDCRGAVWTRKGTIVYSPGPAEGLWIAEADGTRSRPLTQVDFASGERTHRWPAVLPDDTIAFTIGRAGIASFDAAEVAVVAHDGSVRTILPRASDPRVVEPDVLAFLRDGVVWSSGAVLLDGVATESTGIAHFAAGPGGLLVSLAGAPRTVTRDLVWTTPDGTETSAAVPPGEIEEPRLSPSGDRVAFGKRNGTSDIWVHDLQRGTSTRVTSAHDNFGAIWTPDGSALTFSSNRLGPSNIFVAPTDAAAPPVPLVRSDFDLVPGSWSPDGRLLLYTEYHPETGADIWVATRGGRAPDPVLVTRFNEYSPAWSPDGGWCAFTADDTGTPQIYVRRFPSGKRMQVSTHGGAEPIWSGDGKRLFFRSGDGIVGARVTLGDDIAISQPELVLADAGQRGTPEGLPNYYVAGDGARFLIVRPQNRPSTATALEATVPIATSRIARSGT